MKRKRDPRKGDNRIKSRDYGLKRELASLTDGKGEIKDKVRDNIVKDFCENSNGRVGSGDWQCL